MCDFCEMGPLMIMLNDLFVVKQATIYTTLWTLPYHPRLFK